MQQTGFNKEIEGSFPEARGVSGRKVWRWLTCIGGGTGAKCVRSGALVTRVTWFFLFLHVGTRAVKERKK
jgi:hypothetical protein